MSDIKGKCPHCGKKIKAPSEYAGRQISCLNCREPVILPGGTQLAKEQIENQTETKKEKILEIVFDVEYINNKFVATSKTSIREGK